jgi:hypothetical protein
MDSTGVYATTAAGAQSFFLSAANGKAYSNGQVLGALATQSYVSIGGYSQISINTHGTNSIMANIHDLTLSNGTDTTVVKIFYADITDPSSYYPSVLSSVWYDLYVYADGLGDSYLIAIQDGSTGYTPLTGYSYVRYVGSIYIGIGSIVMFSNQLNDKIWINPRIPVTLVGTHTSGSPGTVNLSTTIPPNAVEVTFAALQPVAATTGLNFSVDGTNIFITIQAGTTILVTMPILSGQTLWYWGGAGATPTFNVLGYKLNL